MGAVKTEKEVQENGIACCLKRMSVHIGLLLKVLNTCFTEANWVFAVFHGDLRKCESSLAEKGEYDGDL